MRTVLLLSALLLFACSRPGCSPNQSFDGGSRASESRRSDEPSLEARPATDQWDVVDPYCGMKLRRGEAAGSARHRGKTYYFCMQDHREAFLRDPDRYIFASSDADELDADGPEGEEAGQPRGDGGPRPREEPAQRSEPNQGD